jgi:hypothetical protein
MGSRKPKIEQNFLFYEPKANKGKAKRGRNELGIQKRGSKNMILKNDVMSPKNGCTQLRVFIVCYIKILYKNNF